MTLQQKINALEQLGTILTQAGNSTTTPTTDVRVKKLADLATSVHVFNGWFTCQNVLSAYQTIGKQLSKNSIEKFLSNYTQKGKSAKNIGIILAGNIPLVGFHDILCVLLSGHRAIVKASHNDQQLPLCLCEILTAIEPEFKNYFTFTEGQLKLIDAAIATGSNNSSRYFEYYFNKIPHIIRKNRNSVAVLNNKETPEELRLLGSDIFQYFGLGCRSVSKIFIPQNYNFDNLFKAVFDFQYVLQNNKYSNNYDYNKTIYLMSGVKLLENGFLLLKEDIGLSSPVAVLYYEYYKNELDVIERINMDSPNIQCMVSKMECLENKISFGQTQNPGLSDYADGIDTMKFLEF